MQLELLPRTIDIVRAGENARELNAKAAEATAAFVSAHEVPKGTPIAVFIDQSALPYSEEYICTCDWKRVVNAIKTLEVRGAPAIGIAGAIAAVLASWETCSAAGAADADAMDEAASATRAGVPDTPASASEAVADIEAFAYIEALRDACNIIADARPTAVNLMWAVSKMVDLAESCFEDGKDPECIAGSLFDSARAMIAEDEATNRRIGDVGAALLPKNATVLTHCNAGSLATAFFGTALGVVYAASEKGGITRVFADETRPVGQGARLTVWELSRAGIPVTLICDDMAASVMSKGTVDAVIVGADRVAANGDVANKIGTLGVALMAHAFGVPFYVACPRSTIDLQTPTGECIDIEQRPASEVLREPIAGVDIFNPAFDVTPAHLITAIITEAGAFAPADIAEAMEF